MPLHTPHHLLQTAKMRNCYHRLSIRSSCKHPAEMTYPSHLMRRLLVALFMLLCCCRAPAVSCQAGAFRLLYLSSP